MMRPIDERTLNPCPICGCSVRVWAKRCEDDIEYIIECDNDFCGLTYGISCGYNREEIKKAWNNVTASPTTVSEDCISRQDAIRALDRIGSLDTEADREYARDIFNAIPRAEPKRQKGEWIDDCTCSNCNWLNEDDDGRILLTTYNYCPNCGAYMRGKENE